MTTKRPTDRRQVIVCVRMTKGERAAIRRQGRPGESFSETVRRLVLSEPVVTLEFARIYGSRERVRWVKAQPCLFCGNTPSDNAHVGRKGAGAGRKADADQIAPVCRRCHSLLHTAELHPSQYTLDGHAARTEARWQAHLAVLPHTEPRGPQ